MPTDPTALRALLDKLRTEAQSDPEFELLVSMDLGTVQSAVWALQVGAKTMNAPEPVRAAARALSASLVQALRGRGFVATAEVCDLGSDPLAEPVADDEELDEGEYCQFLEPDEQRCAIAPGPSKRCIRLAEGPDETRCERALVKLG